MKTELSSEKNYRDQRALRWGRHVKGVVVKATARAMAALVPEAAMIVLNLATAIVPTSTYTPKITVGRSG